MELVRRYSNRTDLLERLAEVRLDGHALTSAGRASGVWRVRDRLTDDEVERLIADFLAGTSKRELAPQYGLSLSSVKNLLRKHGVRRIN